MENKINITKYSDYELMLLVSNTEYLWKIRSVGKLRYEIKNKYIYNNNQLSELLIYLAMNKNEYFWESE